LYYTNFLEWIPFEKFQDVTYITREGFDKIYSIFQLNGLKDVFGYWNIVNQEVQNIKLL
jgi:hypothetical protein